MHLFTHRKSTQHAFGARVPKLLHNTADFILSFFHGLVTVHVCLAAISVTLSFWLGLVSPDEHTGISLFGKTSAFGVSLHAASKRTGRLILHLVVSSYILISVLQTEDRYTHTHTQKKDLWSGLFIPLGILAKRSTEPCLQKSPVPGMLCRHRYYRTEKCCQVRAPFDFRRFFLFNPFSLFPPSAGLWLELGLVFEHEVKAEALLQHHQTQGCTDKTCQGKQRSKHSRVRP